MSDSLAIIQQNKITELRQSLADALDFTEVQQARIKRLEAVVVAAKAYEAERYHDTWACLVDALAALEENKDG